VTVGDEIFVTGMLRSGTTLLEKLLAQQPHLSMLSQPFPLLFVEAKRRFLRERGADDEPYPLGHLFGERRYSNDDLRRYLSHWRISREELSALFERMAGYSGQWTRFTAEQLDDAFDTIADARDFADVVSGLLHRLVPLHAPGESAIGGRMTGATRNFRWFGLKETTCEELLPLFLDSHFRCLLILRDPRDVVASLNHGAGRAIAGELRPTLFTVRAWRKSVAFAIACEGHPRFHWCRYEDLAADPAGVLRDIAAKLDIDVVDIDFDHLRDASGVEWSGNSSHHIHAGVSATSIGVFRTLLPLEVRRFIEAASLPELQLLGYETALTRDEAVRALHDFREPYPTRAGIADAATPANAQLEEERLDRLASGDGDDAWFISPVARDRLRAAFLA